MTQHSESCDAILLLLYEACCPCCCGILIASPEKLWPSASRGTLQIMAGTTWQTGLMLHAITPFPSLLIDVTNGCEPSAPDSDLEGLPNSLSFCREQRPTLTYMR